jgi:hypothetical protein
MVASLSCSAAKLFGFAIACVKSWLIDKAELRIGLKIITLDTYQVITPVYLNTQALPDREV